MNHILSGRSWHAHYGKACLARGTHTHETFDEMMARNERLHKALLPQSPRDLTQAQLGSLLPPRNPFGCWQNSTRGHVLRLLNRAGITVHGEPVRGDFAK